jgi:hypothetical protein
VQHPDVEGSPVDTFRDGLAVGFRLDPCNHTAPQQNETDLSLDYDRFDLAGP